MRGLYTRHLILAAGFNPERVCWGFVLCIGRKSEPVGRGYLIPFRFTLEFGGLMPALLRMAVHPAPISSVDFRGWTGRDFEVCGFRWYRYFSMGLDFT